MNEPTNRYDHGRKGVSRKGNATKANPPKSFRPRSRVKHTDDLANTTEHSSKDRAAKARKPQGFAGFNRTSSVQSRRSVKLSPARLAAFEVLHYCAQHECYLDAALAAVIPQKKLSARDKAFARLLATEVVSRRGSLLEILERLYDRPTVLESDVQLALSISLAEMFYLDKAGYAVVDQGVELVRFVEPKASGLANFLLHRALEAKEAFPFGSPSSDMHAAALLWGFPDWLALRLSEDLGCDEALRFMERSNSPAPLFFMVNLARTNGAETLQALVKKGFKIAPIQVGKEKPCAFPVFAFAERGAIADPAIERLLHEGALVISDISAQSIASLALPEKRPQRFLEIGAGRGTKTILLQNAALSLYGQQITLDTLDVNKERTSQRERRLKIARIEQAHSYLCDARDLSGANLGTYDAVFVDAPCSGVGTLRRHHDIRWRLTPDAVTSLAHDASQMLSEAAGLVADGGRLTFATCSALKQENAEVIKAFLSSDEGKHFVVEKSLTYGDLWSPKPEAPLGDAHFACVLIRVP